MAREHWTERAERVTSGHGILGEDEYGDLLVPKKCASGLWEGRFDPRRPTHWIPYLRSRITRKIAFLESVDY